MEKHTSVLLTEAVDALAITPSSVCVDATLGSHGHAERIIRTLGKAGTYIGIDADPEAVRDATEVLRGECRIVLRVGNFKDVDSILEREGIQRVEGILADLGWRIEQFQGNGKGFSFQVDEPLIMTMGEPYLYPFTAYDIVNTWDEENIVSILQGYGEERYAKRIVQGIARARAHSPIGTTGALRDIILASVPGSYRHGKLNPATRTFQALRIAVNDELGVLTTFLEKSIELLAPTGRLVVISFHSLEDRIVKNTFRTWKEEARGLIITKKPIVPGEDELRKNPRSRSAKLRIFQKQ